MLPWAASMGIFDRFSRLVRAELSHQAGPLSGLGPPMGRPLEASGAAAPSPPPEGPPLSDALRGAYEVLGVPPGAPRKTCRAAYLIALKRHHPDRHQDDGPQEARATEATASLNGAWALLEEHFDARP